MFRRGSGGTPVETMFREFRGILLCDCRPRTLERAHQRVRELLQDDPTNVALTNVTIFSWNRDDTSPPRRRRRSDEALERLFTALSPVLQRLTLFGWEDGSFEHYARQSNVLLDKCLPRCRRLRVVEIGDSRLDEWAGRFWGRVLVGEHVALRTLRLVGCWITPAFFRVLRETMQSFPRDYGLVVGLYLQTVRFGWAAIGTLQPQPPQLTTTTVATADQQHPPRTTAAQEALEQLHEWIVTCCPHFRRLTLAHHEAEQATTVFLPLVQRLLADQCLVELHIVASEVFGRPEQLQPPAPTIIPMQRPPHHQPPSSDLFRVLMQTPSVGALTTLQLQNVWLPTASVETMREFVQSPAAANLQTLALELDPQQHHQATTTSSNTATTSTTSDTTTAPAAMLLMTALAELSALRELRLKFRRSDQPYMLLLQARRHQFLQHPDAHTAAVAQWRQQQMAQMCWTALLAALVQRRRRRCPNSRATGSVSSSSSLERITVQLEKCYRGETGMPHIPIDRSWVQYLPFLGPTLREIFIPTRPDHEEWLLLWDALQQNTHLTAGSWRKGFWYQSWWSCTSCSGSRDSTDDGHDPENDGLDSSWSFGCACHDKQPEEDPQVVALFHRNRVLRQIQKQGCWKLPVSQPQHWAVLLQGMAHSPDALFVFLEWNCLAIGQAAVAGQRQRTAAPLRQCQQHGASGAFAKSSSVWLSRSPRSVLQFV